MSRSSSSLSMTIDGYKDGMISSRLEFSSLNEKDLGEYSCNASNSLGTTSTTFSLTEFKEKDRMEEKLEDINRSASLMLEVLDQVFVLTVVTMLVLGVSDCFI